MKVEEIAKEAIARAGVVRVRNAMNPTLWACLIVPIVAWSAAFALKDTSAFGFLIAAGLVPIVMWGLQTAFFSLKDPGRLQSEEFQLRQQALSIIERKGEGAISDPDRVLDLTDSQFEKIERLEKHDE